MFHTKMTVECARTLASYLATAAVIFEADAKLARGMKGHAGLAKQFEKQARQARKLANQFEDAEDMAFPTPVTIEEGK